MPFGFKNASQDRLERIEAMFQRMFVDNRRARPVGYERKQWADDMAKGVYHGPGLALGQVPKLGDPALRMLDMAVYDWQKDVKLEAEATADQQSAAEKAKGMGGTNDLINAWYQERERQGAPISDMTQRDIAQQSEQGYISSASCIMANLSMRLGRTLTWDSAKQVVVGAAVGSVASGTVVVHS